MDYVGNVIRPPSEAESLILQVTVGCSHNMCTFCGTYKDVKFRLKEREKIEKDIDEAAKYAYRFKRVFLADGDVLILPTETILDIIATINRKIPGIERFGVYGNTKSILKKSPNDLISLKNAGLGIVYQGIESGSMDVLRRIKKGASPYRMIEAADKVMDAGILLSQTVILGIGGTELSIQHAVETGSLLGEMSPDYASALTLMMLPGTGLYAEYEKGKFKLPDRFGLLDELRLIIENMNVKKKCYFTSNHASNYLPIKALLPDDREKVVKLLNSVIESRDEQILKPEYMRGL
jgi:radical SAM superfamily enzyme YgiQ (UPF0313 family)